MYKTKNKLLTASVLIAMLGIGQTAIADDGVRQIKHISWDKTGNTSYVSADTSSIPEYQGNVVLIRPADNDPIETSANIGFSGNFHVSLQPGQYTQLNYCSGDQLISVTPTGLKNNDLSKINQQQINITEKANNYYLIDVDDQTLRTQISKIDEESALPLLAQQSEQTHQISRVNITCEMPEVEVVEPEVEVEAVPEVELFVPYRLDVLFEFDKAVIQPVYNARIQKLAEYLAQYPDTKAVIEGHTDSIGTEKYNQKLSEKRAAAVRTELVNKYGVDASRLVSAGYGESKPVAPNSTADGRQQNRRVVAVVTPK